MEQVNTWYNENISIDSISYNNSVSLIYMVQDGPKVLKVNGIIIITIDERGYWRKNGQMTNVSLQDDPCIAFLCDEGKGSELKGIIEGYTDWRFVFQGGKTVSLEKSLFSYDPDLIKRGINHRGFSTVAPENTLLAYHLSRLKGFKYAETDVFFTSDGIPVLLHDNTIDRTSNGSGKVSQMTWNELRSFDFGGWKSPAYKGVHIPSLMEFLDLCRDIGLVPYIELKSGTKQQIEQVVSLVNEYKLAGKPSFISFSARLLHLVLENDPSADVGFLVGTVTEEIIETAKTLKSQGRVFIDSSDCSEKAASLCQAAGIPLEVWTVNSDAVIRALPPYISGVTSDCLHAGRVLHQ